MAGGELHFTMQAEPNKAWATDRAQRPYSMSESAENRTETGPSG